MTNGLLLLEPQNGLLPRSAWTVLSRESKLLWTRKRNHIVDDLT